MIVSFTGTQRGMTPLQKAMLVGALARLCPSEFHHGDCIGADAEAHEIVRRESPNTVIFTHPPIVEKKRAGCRGDYSFSPKDYLTRNRELVAICEELIAAPKMRAEELRSGTWATVRYARRAGKKVHFIWP